ncbi:Glycosyltransferase-like protein LARGE2 [Tetrabaena socialis]|uniref:Glycosyltransferase-like protein LARGE2 n=1 Tax=Tetrabaena socialis TaxID=47790 RepID=A0A2J7ZNT9_9CHLO|nr:Glycosyltransferase-like protein LARGE2 [Tetrabaena socialis]|eukprot:PNH01920.1 Glycosyltransferase-like protein LARGE2 [Tetrabaena socialis]
MWPPVGLELPAAAPTSAAPCALTALLLTERLADPALAGALPINSLRNAALLAASTPLAAMVDVDLAPSASLAAQVLGPAGGSAAEVLRGCEEERGSVWILPAWETHKRLGVADGTVAAEQAIQGDKANLRRLVDSQHLHYFAKAAYSRGHAATNFSRWLEEQAPYVVPYVINYEPWFIISRRRSPAYDVRFRGYGWNKVAQVALVAASNFTFRVHPAAWLVHRPHERSRGQELYSGPAADGGAAGQLEETRLWKGSRASLSRLFHRRVSTLRHVIIRDMRRGTYRAALDPASEHCRAVLPWWGQVRR